MTPSNYMYNRPYTYLSRPLGLSHVTQFDTYMFLFHSL